MSNNKRALGHEPDSESDQKRLRNDDHAIFDGGNVFDFVRILPKFYNRLRQENAFEYVTGNDERYQRHMADEPTLKTAILATILPESTSTVEDWVGPLRWQESRRLDKEVNANPWLPYLWSERPVPVYYYINGVPPEGCIAGTTENPVVEITDEELENLIQDKCMEKYPTPDINGTQEHLVSCLQPHHLAMAQRELQIRVQSWSSIGTHIMQMHKKTFGIFCEYFGDQVLSLASDDISRCNYPAAYQTIRDHYLSQSIASTQVFENRAKELRLEVGQTITEFTHELKQRLYDKALIVALHKDKSKVPDNYMLESNCWDLTDAAITARKHPVLISHHERLNTLIDAVSREPNGKYEHVISYFEGLDEQQQTMTTLLKNLRSAELRSNQREERKARQSNLAFQSTHSNSKPGSYPKGSCRNHPDSTSHTTAQCRGTGKPQSSKKKVRRNGKHCKHCETHKPSVQNTHNTSECRLAPGKNKPNHTQDGKHGVNDKIIDMLTKQSQQIAKHTKLLSKYHPPSEDDSDIDA